MASIGFSRMMGNFGIDVLLEGFYTLLQDPFTTDYLPPDSTGTVYNIRQNAPDGAYVLGTTLELNLIPVNQMTISSGFTWQQSKYESPQEFDEKRFLRTPNAYGYLILDYEPLKRFNVSTSLNYTSPMLVPYFGLDQADPDAGELRTSPGFYDWGVKLSYSIPLNGASVQFYVGMKNLLNSYQDDFDRGIDRDPGYIYGPMIPRTLYGGISFGNIF